MIAVGSSGRLGASGRSARHTADEPSRKKSYNDPRHHTASQEKYEINRMRWLLYSRANVNESEHEDRTNQRAGERRGQQ